MGIVPAGSWDPLNLGSLSEQTLLIDARSMEFVRLIPAPASAFSLRVVTQGDDGRRLAISHWNKLHKGVLARALVRHRPRVTTIAGVLSWAHRAGIQLERVGPRDLDLVV